MILVYFLMTGSEGRERKPHVIYLVELESLIKDMLLTTLVFESQL